MTPRFELHAGGGAFVTVLAAAVLVLLPALAWLQYSWLDQIADADRERRERTLRTAASQLAQELETELGKATMGLQLEGAMVEQHAWSNYAARYQAWADAAISPDIVKAIYFAEGPDLGHEPAPNVSPLRVWKADVRTFELTEWPAELQSVKLRFSSENRRVEVQAGSRGGGGRMGGGARFERFLIPPMTLGNEQVLIAPVMHFLPRPAASDPDERPGPADVKLLGFTIIRLDLVALGREVLPELVRRHLFDDRGHSEYLVGVVRREEPSHVVYESEPGAAAAATAQPDASTALLSGRLGPMFFMGDRRDGPPRKGDRRPPDDRVVVNVFEARQGRGGPSFESRALGGGEGNWRLVAKHRAGSLEAAVSAARTRNFALSSGILALLATAIGLIVVSARRADRLARQQLEFVAAVSHELRTPVSVIGAAAENLADGVVDEPGRVKKYGETIQSEARRLAETVERVLQLAGIAAGRASAARVPIAVKSLIDEAVASCRHEIEKAGATVDVDVAPELLNDDAKAPGGVWRIAGDETALRSALQNLITNAIKYGGDTPRVRVSAQYAGGARITVEDRGLGIDAEDRKHLFEPFYRGREAVSRQIQGSGLGLHLVKKIVEAHGGTVSVQSEAGKGSAFTIALPVLHSVLILRDRLNVAAPKTT